MTKDQIEQMLGEMGIPFRYHHFTQKEMQDIPLPIVVWLTPGTDNFFADGKTYKYFILSWHSSHLLSAVLPGFPG